MNVYNFTNPVKDAKDFENGSILLLGEFEFFHQGHYQLFLEAKNNNQNQNHLIGIFILEQKQKQISQTLHDRLQTLALIGFDFVVVAEFNVELKNTDGKDFINKLLNNYNVKHFICGNDFYFGKDRLYHASQIEAITNNLATAHICELKNYQQQKIASRQIKQMYQFGEFHLLKEFLMEPLLISIELENQVIIWNENLLKPHPGIYYFELLIEQYWYHGIIHFSMDQKIYFELVNANNDLNIFNQTSQIKLLDLARIIINKRFDQIKESDLINAQKFFLVDGEDDENQIKLD